MVSLPRCRNMSPVASTEYDLEGPAEAGPFFEKKRKNPGGIMAKENRPW